MSFKILVPTDFSANANNALNYAIGMAKKMSSHIVLVHAFHLKYLGSDVPMPFMAEQLAVAEQESEARLKETCEKIKRVNGLECDYINKQSLINDLLMDCIKWEEPALVIMGTKGASGLKEALIGSNTAKAIENANCPLLAIPQHAGFRHIQRITFATNYIGGDTRAIQTLVGIAQTFHAQLTILHVCEDGLSTEVENEDMNMFQDKISKITNYDKIDYQLIYGKYLEKSLEAYIKREHVDLIAMSTHKRTFFNKLFNTSDTKKMAYHTKIPLLAFHHEL